MKTKKQPILLTRDEARALLGVSTVTFADYVKRKRLVKQADGKYLKSDVLALQVALANASPTSVIRKKANRLAQVDPTNEAQVSEFERDVLERHRATQVMKAAELEMKMKRHEFALARDAGKLMEKSEVYRQVSVAGGEIVTILRNLGAEIPALFSDKETRMEVREKVNRAIDRAMFAMHKRFTEMEVDYEPEDEV